MCARILSRVSWHALSSTGGCSELCARALSHADKHRSFAAKMSRDCKSTRYHISTLASDLTHVCVGPAGRMRTSVGSAGTSTMKHQTHSYVQNVATADTGGLRPRSQQHQQQSTHHQQLTHIGRRHSKHWTLLPMPLTRLLLHCLQQQQQWCIRQQQQQRHLTHQLH